MTQRLCDVDPAVDAIMRRIEERGGEILPEDEAELGGLTILRNRKLGSIAGICKEWQYSLEVHNAEIARLSERAEGIKARIDRLKAYAASCLAEGEKWEDGTHRLFVKETEAVEGDTDEKIDLNKLPPQYKTTKVTEAADRKLIAAELKNGAEIPGVRLVTRKHLQVK